MIYYYFIWYISTKDFLQKLVTSNSNIGDSRKAAIREILTRIELSF